MIFLLGLTIAAAGSVSLVLLARQRRSKGNPADDVEDSEEVSE